jgi:hypothetical protein
MKATKNIITKAQIKANTRSSNMSMRFTPQCLYIYTIVDMLFEKSSNGDLFVTKMVNDNPQSQHIGYAATKQEFIDKVYDYINC